MLRRSFFVKSMNSAIYESYVIFIIIIDKKCAERFQEFIKKIYFFKTNYNVFIDLFRK